MKKKSGPKITWDTALLATLAERYPHERTDALALELGIPLGSIKWYASKNGWKKTKKFMSDLGRESAKETCETSRLLKQMDGAQRRVIHSGVLLVRGSMTVHLAK